MDFKISPEQEMIISTTKAFVEKELYPHEELVEKTGAIPQELLKEIQKKSDKCGIICCKHTRRIWWRRSRYTQLAIV